MEFLEGETVMSKFNRTLITAATAALALAYAVTTLAADNWITRGRAIQVSPNDSSGDISSVPGAGSSVGSASTIELDITYMMRRNLGLELILATTEHELSGTGVIDGVSIGTAGVLPPTLTLQYHFAPGNKVRPYAGVGVNYTNFYDVESDLAGTDVKLDQSVGLAAQAGLDIDMQRGWFFNMDAKYIDMSTTATLSGAVNGEVAVDIDPWILGVGVGKRF
jgi:outer membrane protein